MARRDFGRREFLAFMAAGSLGAVLAACGQSQSAAPPASGGSAASAGTSSASAGNLESQLYDAAKKEGKLVWWDSFDKMYVDKLSAAFKKRYPGVDVETFIAPDDEQRVRALAEARSGKVSLDFTSTSGGNYFEYTKVGLVSNNADLLEAAGVAKNIQFEGTYNPEWTTYGVSYNSNLVKPEDLPRTWDGFLDPKWKGKLAIDGRLKVLIAATPHWGGEQKVVDYIQKLRALSPIFGKGNNATSKLMVAGEFPIMLGGYLSDYARYAPDHAPWAFAPMNEVYVFAPSPGYTVPEKAPHPNAGRLFMYWFFGPEGRAVYEDRFASNPLPGSGTGPSKMLEQNKTTVKLTPVEYLQKLDDYTRTYLTAMGLPVN